MKKFNKLSVYFICFWVLILSQSLFSEEKPRPIGVIQEVRNETQKPLIITATDGTYKLVPNETKSIGKANTAYKPYFLGNITQKIEQFSQSQILKLKPMYSKGIAWLDESLNTPNEATVSFRAKADQEIQIVFANKEKYDQNNYTWKIIIGGWNNKKAAIVKDNKIVSEIDINQNFKAAARAGRFPLFWISIYNGFIIVGEGFPGENIFLSWRDPNPPTRIERLGFSTHNKEVSYTEVQVLPPIITLPPAIQYYTFDKSITKGKVNIKDCWLDKPLRVPNIGGISFQAAPTKTDNIHIAFGKKSATIRNQIAYEFIVGTNYITLLKQGKIVNSMKSPTTIKPNGQEHAYWASINNGSLILGYDQAGKNPLLIWNDPKPLTEIENIGLRTSAANPKVTDQIVEDKELIKTKPLLTLVNGWKHYGKEFGNVSITKNHDIVRVEGKIKDGKWGHLATLPEGYRPTRQLVFALNNHEKQARVDVFPDGKIVWISGSKAYGWISLTGIVFSTIPGTTFKTSHGWKHYGEKFGNASYRKIGNVIYLEGMFKKGGKWLPARLPENCRPTGDLIFNTIDTEKISRINIRKSGWIQGDFGNSKKTINITGFSFSTVKGTILTPKKPWRHYRSSWGLLTYRKEDNICYLEGLIKGNKQKENMLALLPSGFLPNKQLTFNMNHHDKMARVDIEPNGKIKWVAGTQTRNYISLSGISFSIPKTIEPPTIKRTIVKDYKKISLNEIENEKETSSTLSFNNIQIIPPVYIDFKAEKETYRQKKAIFKYDSSITVISPFYYELSQSSEGNAVIIRDKIYKQEKRITSMKKPGATYTYLLSIKADGSPKIEEIISPTPSAQEVAWEVQAKTMRIEVTEQRAIAQARMEMADTLIGAGGAIGRMGQGPISGAVAASAGAAMVGAGVGLAASATRKKEKAAHKEASASKLDLRREQMYTALENALTEKFTGRATGVSTIPSEAVKKKNKVEQELLIQTKKLRAGNLDDFSKLIDIYNEIVDNIIHPYVVSDKATKLRIFRGVAELVDATRRYNELKEKPLQKYKKLLTLLINIHDNYYLYDQNNKTDKSYKTKFYFGLSQIFSPLLQNIIQQH